MRILDGSGAIGPPRQHTIALPLGDDILLDAGTGLAVLDILRLAHRSCFSQTSAPEHV